MSGLWDWLFGSGQRKVDKWLDAKLPWLGRINRWCDRHPVFLLVAVLIILVWAAVEIKWLKH